MTDAEHNTECNPTYQERLDDSITFFARSLAALEGKPVNDLYIAAATFQLESLIKDDPENYDSFLEQYSTLKKVSDLCMDESLSNIANSLIIATFRLHTGLKSAARKLGSPSDSITEEIIHDSLEQLLVDEEFEKLFMYDGDKYRALELIKTGMLKTVERWLSQQDIFYELR